jgi:hypothetical protein
MPDAEVAECSDDFCFLAHSGLVVLTASLSDSTPKQPKVAPGFCNALTPTTGANRSTGNYGNIGLQCRRSVRPGARKLDHVGPLLGLIHDELPEGGG